MWTETVTTVLTDLKVSSLCVLNWNYFQFLYGNWTETYPHRANWSKLSPQDDKDKIYLNYTVWNYLLCANWTETICTVPPGTIFTVLTELKPSVLSHLKLSSLC